MQDSFCYKSISYDVFIKMLQPCYQKKTPTNFALVGAIHFNSRSNYSTTIFLFETEFPEVIETRYIPF